MIICGVYDIKYIIESVFPKIVDTPYLIFTFSDDKLEFIFKSQNKLPF